MLGRGPRIEIKTPTQLRRMREAGLVVAGALAAAREGAVPGVSTRDLDAAAEHYIRAAGAQSNFKGYHGFPAVLCTSVNDEVVHGIPGSRVLREGDLLSIDCGAIIDGWHADAALTVPVGSVDDAALALSAAAERALWAGIAQVHVGARLTDIGAACQSVVAGRYGIVVDYVGHGIGSAMHMEPSVPHVGPAGRGPALRVGMALAIEPMLTAGSPDVVVLADGWTVATADGSIAAHWEHTVAITAAGPVVMTAPDLGTQRLGQLGVPVGVLD